VTVAGGAHSDRAMAQAEVDRMLRSSPSFSSEEAAA